MCIRDRHKAYWTSSCTDVEENSSPIPLVAWIVRNISDSGNILTFLGIPVRSSIEQYLATVAYDDWWNNWLWAIRHYVAQVYINIDICMCMIVKCSNVFTWTLFNNSNFKMFWKTFLRNWRLRTVNDRHVNGSHFGQRLLISCRFGEQFLTAGRAAVAAYTLHFVITRSVLRLPGWRYIWSLLINWKIALFICPLLLNGQSICRNWLAWGHT